MVVLPSRRLRRLERPRVVIGGFMSVDGKTAPANRVGRVFTRFMTHRHLRMLHRIRSEVDAIIVGVDTVIADNPSLTVRAVKGKNPVRVVLDSDARSPLDSRILDTREAGTIVAVAKSASKEKIELLRSKNVDVFVSKGIKRVDIRGLLRELAIRGVRRVLVEGGGETRWSFFKNNLVDEFFVWIMPYVWGGRDAPTMVGGDGFLNARDVVPLKLRRVKIVDKVMIFWFSVRR